MSAPEPRSPEDPGADGDRAHGEVDTSESRAEPPPATAPMVTLPPAVPTRPTSAPPITPAREPAEPLDPSVLRGATTEDLGHAVAADAQGNVWVAGKAQGTFPEARGEQGPGCFIAAYDPLGRRRWIRQYGATHHLIRAIAVSADGDLVIAGDASSGDAYVARLDREGATRWLRTFGTSGTDYATALALAADGSIYVTSNEQHAPLQSSSFAGLSRYTADGELLFHETWGGSPGAETKDVAVRDGVVYVAGRTNARYDAHFWSWGGGRWIADAALRRYETDGQLRWERSFGETDSGANGVAIDAAGGAIVIGDTFATLDNDAASRAFDTFLRRYDADGALGWTRQLGTRGWDNEQSVAVLADGDLLMAGNASGDFDGDPATRLGAFVMRSDEEGEPRWIRQGIGEVATAMAVDARGRAFTTGWLFNAQTPADASGREVDVFLVGVEPDGRRSLVATLSSAR